MKGYSIFLNLQGWNLNIKLFYVISRTLVGVGVLPLCRDAIGVFDRAFLHERRAHPHPRSVVRARPPTGAKLVGDTGQSRYPGFEGGCL